METITTSWAEIILAILTAAGTITALSETEKGDKVIGIAGTFIHVDNHPGKPEDTIWVY